MSRIPLLTAALLAGIAAPAFAATPINQTRPLDANGKVEIENLKGRIEVRAWDRNAVSVTGSLGDGVEKLVFEGSGSNLHIKAQYPERNQGRGKDRTGPTTLIVNVPLKATLDIESVAAAVHVTGVASRELEIESVSGDIVVAAAPDRADISSVSGSQTLTLNSAGEISAESVSGDIVLRGRLKGGLDLDTVSGKMQVDSRGEAVRRLWANSVSGDIGARVGLAGGGEIGGETVSGSITLHLPRALSARVQAESFSGDLAAPGAKVDKKGFGPGKRLRHRYGSGDGKINVETFSGDFSLSFD